MPHAGPGEPLTRQSVDGTIACRQRARSIATIHEVPVVFVYPPSLAIRWGRIVGANHVAVQDQSILKSGLVIGSRHGSLANFWRELETCRAACVHSEIPRLKT